MAGSDGETRGAGVECNRGAASTCVAETAGEPMGESSERHVKKRVALVPDVAGWAWDSMAHGLKKYAPDCICERCFNKHFKRKHLIGYTVYLAKGDAEAMKDESSAPFKRLKAAMQRVKKLTSKFSDVGGGRSH